MQNNIEFRDVDIWEIDQLPKPDLTIFEGSMLVQQTHQIHEENTNFHNNNNKYNEEIEELNSEGEEDANPQNQKKNDLLVSKYFRDIPSIVQEVNDSVEYEDDCEQLEQGTDKLLLQSMGNLFQFQASLVRFPLQTLQAKKLQGEIINIESLNNILYYTIETESSAKPYKIKIKRRYNDFKLLLNELHQIYPTLILPSVPIGQKYRKLNEQDVEERKRILQNTLNILSLHEELIVSETFRNFMEEESQIEFEARRQKGTNSQRHSILEQINYTVVDKSKKSLQYLMKWWKGNQKLFELSDLENEINKLQYQQQQYKEFKQILNEILKKQSIITKNLIQLDSDQWLFNQQIKLPRYQALSQSVQTKQFRSDQIFNYTQNINYKTLEFEQKIEQMYYSCTNQMMNILDFLDYVFQYYQQLLDIIYDLNEQQKKVDPNQQMAQNIKKDVDSYIQQAQKQICGAQSLVSKYMSRLTSNFEERFIDFQSQIWNYGLDKFQLES